MSSFSKRCRTRAGYVGGRYVGGRYGAALAVVAMVLPGVVIAQQATGSVRGYVTGTAGAPVADAQISARFLETNARRNTTSNASGFYYLGGLRPGQYEITVRRIGVAPQTRPLTVRIAETSDLSISTAQTAVQLSAVQVTGTVVAAQTTRTSEVGASITRDQVANLPNFERNILDLAKLVPGVTATSVSSTEKTFASGGQPSNSVNVFVDGASYKSDVLRGGTAGQDASKGNPFPQSAISELRVLTQNYKAEYQKASSAIILANTRSGTNETAVDAFAYGIGYGYAARDAYAVQQQFSNPQFRRLQAGGSIGGPVMRDKLFYFLTYEGNFRDDPAYVTLGGVTAPAALTSSFAPNLGQFQQQFREHLGLAKLTYIANDRNTVDASFNLRSDKDFRDFGGRQAFSYAVNHPIQVYTGIVNWKYAGDHFLNEAQFSPQQYLWQVVPVNPNIVGQEYQGVLTIGGSPGSQRFTQNRFSFRDDLTRSGVQAAGDHVFKVGVNVDFLGYRADKDLAGNPFFSYASSNNFATPAYVRFGGGNPTLRSINRQFGAYAQDDWSVGKRLTLNLGIRWDVETNPINNSYVAPQALADSLRGPLASKLFVTRPNRAGGNDTVRVIDELGGIDRFIGEGRSSRPTFYGAVQPRLGFSYDASAHNDNSTVFFGGGGIYYDRQPWNTFFDEQYRRQYGQYTVTFSDTAALGVGVARWNPQYLADPATLNSLIGTTGVPEVFLVANDLKPPRTTQASFGIRQALGATQVTVSYNGVFGRNLTNYVRASGFGGLGPNYLTAFVTDDRVKTRYNALQVLIDRPLRGLARFGGSIAYTLAKAEQQGNASDIFWFFDDRYPTVSDLPWYPANGDQRHQIVANGIARIPGDFLLSTIITLGTGLTVRGTDASQGGGPYQQRTFTFTPPQRAFLGIGHVFANQNLDLRLQKDLPLQGGHRVGVVLDLYNAFNSANFDRYDTYIAPLNGDPNLRYGRPDAAAPGRRLQIGLRYGFNTTTAGNPR